MHGLRDPFITAQDHGWKDCHTGDHAEDDTFYHNHTDVHTKRKCHEAQCDKSGYRCNGTSDYR